MGGNNTKELDKLSSRLSNVASSIRFAGIVALTRTAIKAKADVQTKIREVFINRNAWSAKSVAVTAAQKKDPEPFAEVFVRDKYLAEQELGATRTTKNTPAVPIQIYEITGTSENKVIARPLRAASLMKGKKALASGNKPFLARTRSGKRFIFVRKGDERYPIIPLYALDDDKTYKVEPKPFFFDTTQKSFDQNIEAEYDKAFQQFVLRVKF